MFADTDPKTLEVWLDLQRRMSAGEKVSAVFEATNFVMRAQEAGVRERYPDANDREVFLRGAALRLGRDLMISVYGWDPEAH